jgi:membrane protease subunit (stomatin/prohibitin family)
LVGDCIARPRQATEIGNRQSPNPEIPKEARMGIWDKLKGELIDIVEWIDHSNDTMLYRFERRGNEIKNNAKLIVREGQQCAFIREGKLADKFDPGMYELDTSNMPILSTLLGWKHGFESPFKAEVYFASTRRFRDLKWGTKQPITLRDPEFKMVQIRAFGTYVIRIKDVGKFVQEIAGTDGHFTTDELTDDLRNKIVAHFQDVIGESGLSVIDMAANAEEVSKFVKDRIKTKFDEYGVDLIELLVESFTLPPELDKVLKERMSMNMIGNMAEYTQYKTAGAIEDLAKNPGGGGMATGGMGMGMGFAMANQMGQALSPQGQGGGAQQGASGGPPPLPGAAAPVQVYIAVNGQQAGPFDMNGLRQQLNGGQLTRDTLVWMQGMAGWTKAGETPQLATLFNSSPPPLPGV